MINLFDTYNQASWDLHYSLVRSGYDHPTVVINDDGFLPDDVTSPFLYYTGFTTIKAGNPLYFNQVTVPEFWEIRGDGSKAEVFNYEQKRAHIHYAEPKHKRLVKAVDWYDDRGHHRLTDRYNKFGYRFAQTVYNLAGQPILTTYFKADGQEVIVENHQTGDIILNERDQVHAFNNRTDFVLYYLKTAGFELDRIFYNSLSTPFLVAYYLGGHGDDILFWQEPIGDTIPGNMQVLLEKATRSTRVMVQDKQTADKLFPLLQADQVDKVAYLGLLYPFKEARQDHKQALILTNSDQLEGIETLVTQVKGVHFHIGAITEMSPKLTRLAAFSNVSLYPNISMARASQLFSTCGFYLDINHHGEILSAVRTAFEHQQLIVACDTTAHNRRYTADALVFSAESIAELGTLVTQLSQDEVLRATYLAKQHQQANTTTTKQYQILLGSRRPHAG